MELKCLEMTPELSHLAPSLDEAQQLQQQHDDVLQKLAVSIRLQFHGLRQPRALRKGSHATKELVTVTRIALSEAKIIDIMPNVLGSSFSLLIMLEPLKRFMKRN